MRLKGKIAPISGAGRNNGRTIAHTFAREGADLVLIAKQREEQLRQVAKDCEALGAKTLPILADVTKPQDVDRTVKQGLEKFGRVDVLMSVAGLRRNKLPWDFTFEEWQHMFAINVHATFLLSKALTPGMIQRRSGSIVALGGNSSLTCSSPYTGALASSKHALHGLIKGLAQALGPYGVRANMLSLANIENEILDPESYRVTGPDGKEIHTGTGGDPNTTDEQRAMRSPLRRMGRQQEVANAALFLASDESSYITGDRIICAGGIYM